jgi:hypothetical protein
MPTITYINIIVLLFVLILTTVLGSTSTTSTTLIETYRDLDVLIADKGLPLSFTKGLNVRDTTYYKEVDGETIDEVLVQLIDVLYKDESTSEKKQTIEELASLDKRTSATSKISQRLITRLNKELNKTKSKKDDFKVLISDVQSMETTEGTEFIITTRHIVHRESRMYGFVIYVKSLWNSVNEVTSSTSSTSFKGIIQSEVTGILPEDALQAVKGCEQLEASNLFRPYTDNVSFIQSEAIMKSKKYEDDIIKEQVYGLSQDRGISSLSFK